MSEQTAQKLQEARAEEERLQAEVDALKQRTLSDVAAGLPDRIDEIGKRSAHREPDVTKHLGAEGIKAFRADLREASTRLAAEVEGAINAITWPAKTGSFGAVKARDVHSALFKFLYGPRVHTITSVFERHGFTVHGSGILPQSLYDESEFTALAEALEALSDARARTAAAEAEHDRDIVDSLWED